MESSVPSLRAIFEVVIWGPLGVAFLLTSAAVFALATWRGARGTWVLAQFASMFRWVWEIQVLWFLVLGKPRTAETLDRTDIPGALAELAALMALTTSACFSAYRAWRAAGSAAGG